MDINAYLERGREAVKEGELDLAAKYFESILREAPNHPEALEGMESIKVARARLGWGPIGRFAVYCWCQLLLAFGKRQSALPKLRILYASNPTSYKMAECFAQVAVQENCLTEAAMAYRTVLHLQPNRISALEGLGMVLRKQDNNAEAIKCYQKLRSLRPNDDQLDHLLRDLMAQEYARTGVPEDLKAARRAIEKEKSQRIRVPGTPDFTEKLERLAEQCERHPEDLDSRVEMTRHLRKGGQLHLAQRVLSELLDEHPDHGNARLEQALLWRENGELELAAGLYGQLVSERQEDEELRCLWLETSVEKERKNGRKADDPLIAKLQGEIFTRRRSIWEKHLIAHPEDLAIRAKLAELLLENGEITAAIEHTQRVIQVPSWGAAGFLLLGKCFLAQKKYELAAAQFQKSIDANKNKDYMHVPSDSLKAAYYWLGVTLEEMGRIHEAADAYGQVYAADIGYLDIRERYERATSPQEY